MVDWSREGSAMEGEKKRSGWLALSCVVALTAALVVYPLSIGPAVWLAERKVVSDQTVVVLATLYWPVDFVGRSCVPDWARHAYRAYVDWWR
jgi:hypothetical protein